MTSGLTTILHHPRSVLTMMVVMVMAGIMTYLSIPKEANPDIDVPVFYVSVSQNGVSPEDAERLLVRPLENKLRSLEGLKEITAIASEGHAGIILEFNIDFDKDKALADVRDKADQAKAEMPAEADEPSVTETNFSLEPTISIAVFGDVPERTLYTHAKRLQDEIETIPSVLEANLNGQREELLEVIIDTMKLESYNITQTELINAVRLNNQLIPAGFIDTGKGRFNVKVPGLIENSKHVFNIPIKNSGDGVVTLGDVAKIKRTFKDATVYTRVNGKRAITISVKKRIGTNIIENNNAVRKIVAAAAKDWPDAIKVRFMLDESTSIFEILGSLQSSIMTAVFLVMIVVIAALGLRSAILVGIAIPASFMIGFMILGLVGMTVNMMVMFGLVLTVGMLVDGAIVIVEYADRKMHEGHTADEAYVRAAKLMFWPIIASTATTLAAFLPMLLWPGVPGEFMSYLPIMVIIVLSASLLTALIFLPATGAVLGRLLAWIGTRATSVLPVLYGLVAAGMAWFVASKALPTLPVIIETFALDKPDAHLPGIIPAGIGIAVGFLTYFILKPIVRWYVTRQAAKGESHAEAAARMISGQDHFDENKVPGMTGVYVRTLKFFSGSVVGNIFVIGAVLASSVYVFALFGSNNAGVEFFVDEEPRLAFVFVSARGNMSADEARVIVKSVEERILPIPGIKNVIASSFPSGASSGGGGGTNGVADKPTDMVGEISLEFEDYCCRPKAVKIFEEIRKRTADLPGLSVEIRKVEGGPPSGKDINLQVSAVNYDDLAPTVARIREHFEKTKGLRNIEDDRPLPGIEWEIAIDRKEAGRYNANIASVGTMVQLATTGVLIGKYRPNDSDDEIDIRVRLPVAQRSLDQLDQLRVRTQAGLVPISNFVERKAKQKVSSIKRKDALYVMSVKAGVAKDEGFLVDERVGALRKWLETQSWKDGVFVKFRGADEEQKKSGEFLATVAVPLSIFIMFIILVTQFNSFYQTFLTLSTVMMSIVGVLIGMMITGQKFSIIMTGTGVVALAGIVVNNAIVLIDTYNRFRAEGTEPLEAILKTSAQRIRPILLTTITTIAGLIPMATQVNFDFFNQVTYVGGITAVWWVQLSTAVISGLAYSTILTLIVIPTMLAVPSVWSRTFSGMGQRSIWQSIKRFVVLEAPMVATASAAGMPSSTVSQPAAGAPNDTVSEPLATPAVAKPVEEPAGLPTEPKAEDAKGTTDSKLKPGVPGNDTGPVSTAAE